MAALKTLGHAFVNPENSAFYAEQQNEWLIADSHIYRLGECNLTETL